MRSVPALFSEKKTVLLLSLIALMPVSRAVLFVRDATTRPLDAYATVDLQNSINIVATALMIAVVLGPGGRSVSLRTLRGPTQWLVLYYGFCLLSCAWAASPAYAAYRAVELMAILFFMGYILDSIDDPCDGILYLCRFSAVTALLPYLSEVIRYGGLFQHTNSFSTCGAFGAALALASIRRGVLRFAQVKYSLLACLAAVIFGTSSASNISMIIGILMIAAASRQRTVSWGRLLLLSLVAFFVVTRGFEVVRPYVFPGKTPEHIRSMRGRASIYLDFWNAFQEYPVLGNGFASGERSVELSGGAAVESAHNAILSVAVNTGIIGLLCFCLGFYRIALTLYRADLMGDRVAFPILVAMVVGLVNSMSYPLVGSSWKYVTTPFLGIVAYASVFLAPRHYRLRGACVPAGCCDLCQ